MLDGSLSRTEWMRGRFSQHTINFILEGKSYDVISEQRRKN